MVSFHIVPVIVCLIIKVISSTFRFKCGADFRLSNERLWNAQLKINDTRPHTIIGERKTHTNTGHECCRYPFSCEIFQISR